MQCTQSVQRHCFRALLLHAADALPSAPRYCRSYPQDFEPPSGDLAKAIEAEFGSVDSLIAKFNPKTAAVQVSHRMTTA